MKKFEFRLQRILELREKLGEKQKAKLAAAAFQYQKIIQQQREAYDKALEVKNTLSEKIKDGSITIEELKNSDLLRYNADRLAVSLKEPLEEARLKMEKEQKEYNKYHKEKKVVEILRDRKLKEYKQAEIREETTVMDEISKRFRM